LELPFENLSVLRDDWISLDVKDIIKKISGPHRRGGYCFELNKLLACLLLHLGFEVQLLKARVWLDDGQTPRLPTPPLHTHICLLVRTVPETFLCDVAFGKIGLLEPLSLQHLNQGPVKNGHVRMKLESSSCRNSAGFDVETYTLWYTPDMYGDTAWMRGYSFVPADECHFVDFIPLNAAVHGYFESPFTQRLWFEKRGREHCRILGAELVMNDGQKVAIESAAELQKLLHHHFKLTLSLDECKALHGLAMAEKPKDKWSRLLALRRRRRTHSWPMWHLALPVTLLLAAAMWRCRR